MVPAVLGLSAGASSSTSGLTFIIRFSRPMMPDGAAPSAGSWPAANCSASASSASPVASRPSFSLAMISREMYGSLVEPVILRAA